MVVVVAFLIALTYFTTDAGGGVQSRHFYKSTVNALDNAHDVTAKKSNDAAKDRSHIQRLDVETNNNNNNGGTRKPSTVNNNDKQEKTAIGSTKLDADNNDMDEISVAGRTKMSAPKLKDDQTPILEKKPESSGSATSGHASGGGSVNKHEDVPEHGHEHEDEDDTPSQEEQEASAELDSILKRSPIIVFSKSYCPFSKKAKNILSQYSIVPAPYIVELDLHPLGPHIQQLLGKITGRRTVPNVMINGLSIGGGDDIAALDHDDALISKIKSTAGKSIMEVKRLPKAEQEEDGL